jgi:hypothetical protein
MTISYDEIVRIGSELQEETQIEPIWSLNRMSNENVLDWITRARASIWDASRERANKEITNMAMMRGIYWENQDRYADFRNLRTRQLTNTKLIAINDFYHYVDTLVSKLNKFRPGVIFSPWSNEFQDKQGATIAGRVYEAIVTTKNLAKLFMNISRRVLIGGEQFVLPLWNSEKGPISERWLKAKEKYGDRRMRFRRDDWVYEPDMPERIGDLCFYTPYNWRVFVDPAECPEESQWLMWCTYPHKEEIKFDYPKYGPRIDDYVKAMKQGSYSGSYIDTNVEEDTEYSSKIPVIYLWVRSSKYLSQGLYVKCIPGSVILEMEDNPFSEIPVLQESEWGDLPCERLTYIDSDDDLHGLSALQFIQSLVHTKNKLVSMMNKNIMMFHHHKFLVHKSAGVQFSELTANDSTVVEWAGIQEPKLVNWGMFDQGLVEFAAILNNENDKIMKIHPISQGTPPPGIKAGVALRLLEEVEDQQLTTMITKQNHFTISLARRIIGICGKYYKKGDGRLVNILGQDSVDLLDEFDPDLLSKSYNVSPEPISQFARSPAARTQQIIDLLEVTPNVPKTQEQLIDALQLVKPEKITDPAVTAIRAAEYVNELCAQNKPLPEPRPGDNYIVKWHVHMSFYQRPSFINLPKKAQQRFLDMMLGLEYLMAEHTRKNPSFRQILLTIPTWPAFYNLPPEMLQSPPPPEVQIQQMKVQEKRMDLQEKEMDLQEKGMELQGEQMELQKKQIDIQGGEVSKKQGEMTGGAVSVNVCQEPFKGKKFATIKRDAQGNMIGVEIIKQPDEQKEDVQIVDMGAELPIQ